VFELLVYHDLIIYVQWIKFNTVTKKTNSKDLVEVFQPCERPILFKCSIK